VEPFADPADQIAWNAGREIAAQQLDSEAHWIHDIRLALDKIQNGGYGKCDGCEEPIGQRRLDALPWARFCVACQSALEAGANRKMVAFDRAA
jgi:DnaK suppressor protein